MANRADFSVQRLCRALGVSTSGNYAWRNQPPSARVIEDAVLTKRIRDVHRASDGTYVRPRVRGEMIDHRRSVSRKRVARLMRKAQVRGVSRRQGFVVTTRRDARERPAPDLVRRRFEADAPNRLWMADMNDVPTWAGFVSLACVMDVWSRRIVAPWQRTVAYWRSITLQVSDPLGGRLAGQRLSLR